MELTGYAELCRSETTEGVLAAWGRSPSAGYAALQRALGTSGVEAPDIDDFRWGDYMGIEEARLRLEASVVLEKAIDAGHLIVVAKGWRETQRGIARGFLGAPHVAYGGKTPLQVIQEERFEHWLNPGRGERRRRLIASIADRIREPIDPPEGVHEALRPLLRLLELAREGAPLTEKQYIAPAIVRELVEQFGWWDWRGEPRSESEVGPLIELHELARKARLVRHSKRVMRLTTEGRRALEDPGRCWRALVCHLAGGDAFMGALCEVTFAALVPGPTDLDSIERAMHGALEEWGWKDRGSQGLDLKSVSWSLWDLIRPAKLLGLIETGEYPDRSIRLTQIGQAAALGVLRERAVGPRARL